MTTVNISDLVYTNVSYSKELAESQLFNALVQINLASHAMKLDRLDEAQFMCNRASETICQHLYTPEKGSWILDMKSIPQLNWLCENIAQANGVTNDEMIVICNNASRVARDMMNRVAE